MIKLLHLAVAAALGMGAINASAEPVRLRFASFEPPQAPITGKVFTPWAEAVNADSQGTLNIEIFAGGQLGRNPLQQLKLVEDGIADLTWGIPGYTPGRFADVEVVELPFVVDTAREGSVALTRMHRRGELKGFEKFKLLLIGIVPANNLHGSFPIKSVDDLKGKRIRTGSAQLARTIQSLGGAPVQVGAPQVAESLSKGVIDGTLGEWNFIATFKIDQIVNHHLVMPMGALAVFVPMLQSRFDALPEQAKAALEKHSGMALAERFAGVVDSNNEAVRQRVQASGKNKVVVPDAGTVAQWQQATAGITDAWRKADPRNDGLYAGFVKEVAAVRATK